MTPMSNQESSAQRGKSFYENITVGSLRHKHSITQAQVAGNSIQEAACRNHEMMISSLQTRLTVSIFSRDECWCLLCLWTPRVGLLLCLKVLQLCLQSI